jgi:hypothetical protein
MPGRAYTGVSVLVGSSLALVLVAALVVGCGGGGAGTKSGTTTATATARAARGARGASIGGRAVVTAAARGGPRQVDAVVSLSGERILGAQ